MDNKKVISIIEDLVFEDINQEDYWKAVKEAKAFIDKVKTKQLILNIDSNNYTKEDVIKAYDDGFNDGNQRDLDPTS